MTVKHQGMFCIFLCYFNNKVWRGHNFWLESEKNRIFLVYFYCFQIISHFLFRDDAVIICSNSPLPLLTSAVLGRPLPQNLEECCYWHWRWQWFCKKKQRDQHSDEPISQRKICGVDQPYFSPPTFLVSLASVPLSSSSHPPDIFGRLLFFWIFLSSLSSSDRKSLNALSPVGNIWQDMVKKNTFCCYYNSHFFNLGLLSKQDSSPRKLYETVQCFRVVPKTRFSPTTTLLV